MGAVAWFNLLLLIVVLLLSGAASASDDAPKGADPPPAGATSGQEEVLFEIRGFAVEGNTLLHEENLREVLKSFIGQGKTADDVERARDALEGYYHEIGYPTVLVNLPEQVVEDGVIRLQVIESRVGRVIVTGNRYFTAEKILRDFPSFRAGEILYAPDVQKQLNRANRNPDLKVTPSILPGQELGIVNVELRVEDHLPLHGSLEINNRYTQGTTPLRLNGMISYENLWQRGHSLSAQYQVAPMDVDEVQVVAGSYVLPAPWNDEHSIVLYGLFSESGAAFGSGFQTFGRGFMVGSRYVMPLAAYKRYTHNVTLGVDYKDFSDTVGSPDEGQDEETPITYLPFSVAYSAAMPDDWGGVTQFSANLKMAFRGLVTDQRQFEVKRYRATSNFLCTTMGVERSQQLPANMGLFARVDGQIADQPLINNEQYVAGGMTNVRGYLEAEVLGDNAFHGSVELTFPDPVTLLESVKWLQTTPFLFYDAALLSLMDPLPGQQAHFTLQGAGIGIKGLLAKRLKFELDWGVALNNGSTTTEGTNRFYFQVNYQF